MAYISIKRTLWAVLFALSATIPAVAMNITLTSAMRDSAVVGQTMTWTGAASDAGAVRYRFRVRRSGANFRMIRDYGPLPSLDWAADREGSYEIEVSAQNVETGEISTTSQFFTVASRLANRQTVVNATEHPLVFLFSAPPCAPGARMRVAFQPVSGGPVTQTPFQNCAPGLGMNFYLAGLYAGTSYSAQAVLDTGNTITQGTPVTFQTGSLPEFSWNQTVLKPATPGTVQPILLGTSGGSQIATDLNGNVVWFNPSPVTYATRVEAGGYLWGFLEDDSQPVEQQGIREVDLLGRTVLETNAARVNEQLVAMGKHTITGFHHEVRTLPDGRVVALASEERLLTDIQGPGTVDVLGDMIVVFDQNMQVVWTWDAFDHLDVTRRATLGETCTTGAGGCAPFYLASVANDWTHGNAVQQTPDGNLLYSARHQDWLIKINYANGEGDGRIIWRLGRDGDFTYSGADPYPWFSHQHDGNFVTATRIAVFDNGNTRITAAGGEGSSRGQVIELDEQNRTATLLLNADLGVYSQAVGSAQHLLDRNYHFDAGYVPAPAGLTSYAFEVDASGQIVSSIEANTMLYRSIRMTDMYTSN